VSRGARLSIIDLSPGDQPIASEDGQTRIIVNGGSVTGGDSPRSIR